MPPLPSPWEAGLELSGRDALSFSPRMVSGIFRFDADGLGLIQHREEARFLKGVTVVTLNEHARTPPRRK